MAPRKTQSDIEATSTLRYIQYEQKTLSKPKRLDGLLKEVTEDGVSEAGKAAFGCKLSNRLRVDLETNAMRVVEATSRGFTDRNEDVMSH